MMLMIRDFGKTLTVIGVVFMVVGALFHFGSRLLPLGRLPGDFSWQGKNWSVHFPLASCLVISVVITLIANIFFRK
jgi:hypothetical protein